MLADIGFAALRAAARRVPSRVGLELCRRGATMYHDLAPRKRRAVADNMRVVIRFRGGDEAGQVEHLTRRTFESHGVLLYEWLREGDSVELTFEGLRHLEAARRAGRGAIIATCHLGNWEVAALELARRGFALNVVTGEQLGRMGPAVRRQKAEHGIRVIRPSDGMRRLYEVLQRGQVVALLIDGDVHSGGRRTTFLGIHTELPFGAARLALRTGADLIPAGMVRIDAGRYRVHISPPVDASQGENAMMESVLRTLEPLIANHPHQWCLFRRLWQTEPAA